MGNQAGKPLLAPKFAKLTEQTVTTLAGESQSFRSLFDEGGAVVVFVRRMG
jgi:hypothetical protein